MKLIFTILLFFGLAANAQTTYYVSNAGNDANNGLTTATSWQHLSKVNTFTFSNGDTVKFNRGSVWNERLIPPSSNMIYTAYGTGSIPEITGFETQTGFTNVSGNVWRSTATNAGATLQMVLINGHTTYKARYPNASFLTYTPSASTKTRVVVPMLTGTPNYTGFELVTRTAHWIYDVNKVSSQNGDTLFIADTLTYTPVLGGNGCFLQNDSSLVDAPFEYSYKASTKSLIVYSVGSPNVKAAIIDTLVWIRNKSNIVFDNLSFTGANRSLFRLDTSSNITVKNCYLNHSGVYGISGGSSSNVTIDNDSIQNCLSGSIYLRNIHPLHPIEDTCDYATITNNYIKNTGIYAGMGLNNNGTYNGINVVGHKPIIEYNRVDSSGYINIFFNGDTSSVRYNYVSNSCFIKDDGAGIYTVVGGYLPSNYNDGSIIGNNIVRLGLNAQPGTTSLEGGEGIYADNYSNDISIIGNTIDSCTIGGLKLNDTYSLNITDNTIYNAIGNGIVMIGTSSNQNIKRNKIINPNNNFRNILSYSPMAITDSNYYSRITGESDILSYNGGSYSLSGWRTATGQDAHSFSSPSNITSAKPLLYFNPTKTDSTITFPYNNYVDLEGNIYYRATVLHPFTSVVVYKIYEPPISGIIKSRPYTKMISK